MDAITTPPDLESVDDMGPAICALPEIPPQFFIPRLEDKPQNPIMDTLQLMYRRADEQKPPSYSPSLLPPELNLLSEEISKFEQEKRVQRLDAIWELAMSQRLGKMVRNIWAKDVFVLRCDRN